MNIREIYRKYKIPPNLQRHMLSVAAVGSFIVDHWKDQSVLNKTAITQALLLHDTGNIIKFDFSRPQLMGEEAKNIAHWKQVQTEFREKYQNDEHVATEQIAHEVNLNVQAFELLNAVGSAKLQSAVKTGDWNKKVVCYSDFRVDPSGIVSVNTRFDDIIARYKGRTHELGNIESTEKRRTRCLELESQILPHLTVNLNNLTDSDIASYLKTLSDFEITA